MQFEEGGVTIWCGTSDAPAPEQVIGVGERVSLTMGVRPQSASHEIGVLYRVNGAKSEVLRAGWVRSDPSGTAQYFRAVFPAFAPGDRIEYRPICGEARNPLGQSSTDAAYAGKFEVAQGRSAAGLLAHERPAEDAGHGRDSEQGRAAPALPARGQLPSGEPWSIEPTGRRTTPTNRKLLVSVFNPQEAREAVLGGARIVDSEDPRSALGNIRPVQIMAISDAVLDSKRDLEVQLSTNIGEDQLLFRRSPAGQALEKSPYEIAGKASQAAIGVACSMDTRVHPCNIVKVGLDGMELDKLREILSEVVVALKRTEQYRNSQVMSVLFVQDLALWDQRKSNPSVRQVLVELREFFPSPPGPDAFDLQDVAVGTLRDASGRTMFTSRDQVSLGSLIRNNVLPPGSNSSFVQLNPLFDQRQFFPRIASGSKTNRAVIKAMVDATADSGAQGIMLDTSILTKVCNVGLVDTSRSSMVDVNRFRNSGGLEQRGILNLEDIRFFADYCHFRGVFANVAGSIESYQAQQLWVLVPELDQVSSRGSSSAVEVDPSNPTNTSSDTRQHRIIKRELVRGLAPPEHYGVLNLPEAWMDNPDAVNACSLMREMLAAGRAALGWPALETYFINSRGQRVGTLSEGKRVSRYRN